MIYALAVLLFIFMFSGAVVACRETLIAAPDSRTRINRWRFASAGLVSILYLASGFLAQRWWMRLGTEASVWGVDPNSLADRANYSIEPIALAFIPALPSVLICVCSRSKVIHLFLIGLAAIQVYSDVHYLYHGSYFGCDRNGCSAEENFSLIMFILAVMAVVGAFAIKALLLGFSTLLSFAQRFRKSKA